MNNLKFEKAARNRKIIAFWLAVLLHVAVFAAISYHSAGEKWMPDIVKSLFEDAGSETPEVPVP